MSILSDDERREVLWLLDVIEKNIDLHLEWRAVLSDGESREEIELSRAVVHRLRDLIEDREL